MSRTAREYPGTSVLLILIAAALGWLARTAWDRRVPVDAGLGHDVDERLVAARHGIDRPALRIDINSASAAELDLLPGIGPKLAERIVEDRAIFGAFASVHDLSRVYGIGPRTIEDLRGLVTATDAVPRPDGFADWRVVQEGTESAAD